jgi:hypothetical protein
MPTENQIKLLKLKRLADVGSVGVFNELEALEDKNLTLEQALLDAQNTFKEHISIIDGILHQLDEKKLNVSDFQAFSQTIKVIQGTKGDMGITGAIGLTGPKPIAGIDYPIPRDGRDGLNGETIVGPTGKDGKNGSPDTGVEIVDKVNELPIETDFQIAVEHIKGLDKKELLLTDSIINRAIGIVDQRTSFLIQKVSNLKTQVDNLPTTSGVSIQTPTGVVNGSNTVFTFSTAPSIIVVDGGRMMQATSSDGTVNWTGTTVVTLTVAPNFDIFGL